MSFLAAIIICACACQAQPSPSSGDDPQTKDVPDAPSMVKASLVGADTLAFTWSEVSGAEFYTYKLLKGLTLVQDGKTANTSVLLKDLDPETTYRFAVRSDNSKASSEYTSYLEATTLAESGPGADKPKPLDNIYEAMKIPAVEEDGIARAFPGAEGGGMYTSGGRGGCVYHVTTLSDGGQGSLRYGIEKSKRPCTIVFDVAGTITLGSPLSISKGDITIAGQTAPGDGICLKGRNTRLNADNVIIRFVRFRLGDEDSNADDGDDCIWGRYHSNIILDHCSMSWSIDECASFYANSYFTMQWCILAESMKSSQHSKGNHGYGGIWGGESVSFHHNALAHHDSRNPRFDHPHIYQNHSNPAQRGAVDFRCNVVYDWGSNSSYGGEGYGAGKGTGINMVANYYKPGPSSTDRKYFMDAYGEYSSCSDCGGKVDDGYPLLYMSGNVHTKYSDISEDNSQGIYWHSGKDHANYGETSSSPFAIKGPSAEKVYTTTSSDASAAADAVCKWGGASLVRDKVDKRVCSDIQNGTGRIIDCVNEASGKTSVASLYGATWPVLSATEEQIQRASSDTDSDGIPDYYEYLFSLDPEDPEDGPAKTIDKNGRYTNLEMYLHYLVRDIVSQQTAGGSYTEID